MTGIVLFLSEYLTCVERWVAKPRRSAAATGVRDANAATPSTGHAHGARSTAATLAAAGTRNRSAIPTSLSVLRPGLPSVTRSQQQRESATHDARTTLRREPCRGPQTDPAVRNRSISDPFPYSMNTIHTVTVCVSLFQYSYIPVLEYFGACIFIVLLVLFTVLYIVCTLYVHSGLVLLVATTDY